MIFSPNYLIVHTDNACAGCECVAASGSALGEREQSAVDRLREDAPVIAVHEPLERRQRSVEVLRCARLVALRCTQHQPNLVTALNDATVKTRPFKKEE